MVRYLLMHGAYKATPRSRSPLIDALARLVDLPGRTGSTKRLPVENRYCSLIYKDCCFRSQRLRPLFTPPHPRRNHYGPSSLPWQLRSVSAAGLRPLAKTTLRYHVAPLQNRPAALGSVLVLDDWLRYPSLLSQLSSLNSQLSTLLSQLSTLNSPLST